MHLLAGAAMAAVFFVATGSLALAASKTFDVAPFSEIEISSGINAVVTVGGAQSVVAESPRQEELDELIVEVSGGKLRAYTDWNLLDLFDWGPGDRQTTITISVPSLSAADANSGADIDVSGIAGNMVRLNSTSGADLVARDMAATDYDLSVSSGADLTVEGTCESAKADASSGADLRADKLLCADVDATASSGASADVYASASLKANASSGASIDVYGKPATVDDEASSGGDINLRD